MVIKSSREENIVTCFTSRYVLPIQVYYQHLVNEVTICFKPLGINQFLNDTNDVYSKITIEDFTFLQDFNATIKEIFSLDREAQIQKLEKYLISKLQIKDFSLIEKILTDLESDIKIEAIAKKHQITRQYLNRIFKKHIGKSLSEYRKIHRFRNSLTKQKENKNLTELSQLEFYDQSHFIRDFKELARINPQRFFKNVEINNKIIWLFD